MEKVIAVVGPTASGKTSLAVAVAKAVNGEVISADSMQVYKGMPIATAAASFEEQGGVPHHLLSFLDPSETFSVADYVKLAGATVDEITGRGHVPVVCGGTGLFVDALFQNLQFVPTEKDEALRERLLQKAALEGNESLHQELRRADPRAAETIHPNNVKRVARALEVYYTTGRRFSELEAFSHSVPSRLEPLFIGINYQNRQALYDRINMRVDRMVEQGLLEEAERLLSRQDAATCRQAIGHKELVPYFRGEITLDQALEGLKRETRRYAKRQLTWFRRRENINWFYPDVQPEYTKEAIHLAQEFLKGAKA